jgi:hypothetical protein
MGRKSNYWEFLLVLIALCSISIIAQDNTNNKMQDKSNISDDKFEKMINKNATYYSNDLVSKLNLTKSQAKYIHNVLYSYYTNGTEDQTSQKAALRQKPETMNLEQDPLMQDDRNIRVNEDKELRNAQDYPLSKIQLVLDSEQRNKWTMIKDAWWLNVKSALSNSSVSSGDDNDILKVKREYEDSRDYENYDVYSPGYDVK